MRAITLWALPLWIASSGCIVLGIDFDKKGVTSSTQSSVASTGSNTSSSSGSGGSGGEADIAGPDCGGIDLLTGLDSTSPLYRLTTTGTPCTNAWTNGPEADFSMPMNLPGARCQVATNWYFDGRGRRYVAHLLSQTTDIGTTTAGIVALGINNVQISLNLHNDGTADIVSSDLESGNFTVLAGPIGIQSDSYIALRFSGDGTRFWFETASSPNPVNWTERVSLANDVTLPTYVDLSSIRVGVDEANNTTNPDGGTSRFDDVHGESVPPTTPNAVACPAAGFKATFSGAFPNTLTATANCSNTSNGQLTLCPIMGTGCSVRTTHLYQLAGSGLDLDVHGLDATDVAELIATSPTATVAEMSVNGSMFVGSGVPLKYETTTTSVPVFLDISQSTSGALSYGTHLMQGKPTIPLPDQPAPTDPALLVEIRIQATTTSTTPKCVVVDGLNLP